MSTPRERAKRANQFASWIVIAILSYVLGVFTNGAYTYLSIQNSQSNWCSALVILTEHPVPPPAPGDHQAQKDNYNFYQSILSVERAFHCARH